LSAAICGSNLLQRVHSPGDFAASTQPIRTTFTLNLSAHTVTCFAQTVESLGINLANASDKKPLRAALAITGRTGCHYAAHLFNHGSLAANGQTFNFD
jgi:hypothetical protein